MRTLAYPLALLVVLVVPALLVGAAAAALRWGRWLVTVGGVLGLVGIALVAGAAVNLFVPRTCDAGGGPAATPPRVNRPIISLAVDDGACFRAASAQLTLAPLAGVATSSLVLLRRSSRRGAGGATVAPSR